MLNTYENQDNNISITDNTLIESIQNLDHVKSFED